MVPRHAAGGYPRQISDIHRACFTRDVRPLLASIDVPTLVLHRREDRYIQAEAGRYLAGHIPHAKFVLLPGGDSLIFAGDIDGLADEIEEFLTGRHQPPEGDAVLAAVLFTDIVRSTEQATALGPRAWRRLSGEHDALVRTALRRHCGREIKTIGDGFLATFDGGMRAVRCAVEISGGASALGLAVRAGVHAGDVEVRGSDVAGLAVTIAKRICDVAGPGQVLVSETIRELTVGSSTSVSLEGTHTLKGVPNEWRLWAVRADVSSLDTPAASVATSPSTSPSRNLERPSGASSASRLPIRVRREATRRACLLAGSCPPSTGTSGRGIAARTAKRCEAVTPGHFGGHGCVAHAVGFGRGRYPCIPAVGSSRLERLPRTPRTVDHGTSDR